MTISNYYFLVLDIETSKEMEYDEVLGKEMPSNVWLSYGVCKFVDINGTVLKTLRFREWSQLDRFLDKVSRGFRKKLLCFVHNLSYEFDFLIKNLSIPKTFICNSTHNVIASTLEKYCIEFRCTYQLSKLPLSKIGELFHLPKLDSEYRTIYPEDEVTEEEWVYCERDCEILIPYILDELKTYKMLCFLPYTSTGKVRRKLQEKLKNYDDTEWDKMPPEDCYEALNKAFRGGLTMSNPRFTNRLIKTKVRSFDEKSKYPGVMLTEEFPRSIRRLENFDNNTYKNYKFWIARVKLINVYSKFEWGVISSNTCEKLDAFTADIFNGKIINCTSVELYLTSVDLKSYLDVYDISAIEFLEFYPCENYGRLPQPFIDLIIEFADDKTRIGKELAEVEAKYGFMSPQWLEKNREYMEAKAKLNGIYGMMVQKLTPQEFYIDEVFLWHEKDNSYKFDEKKRLKRNFLFGVFITAYARHDLVLNIIRNCPFNFVYCDTDSIKFIDIGKEFVDMNKNIPDDLKGYSCIKGFNRFEEEKPYEQFLTYGAKKYAFIKDGKFGFVVAGLPKITAINSMEEFTLGTTYENCKLAKRYIYRGVTTDVDFYTHDVIRQFNNNTPDSRGGVALFETDYKLDMTKSDKFYLKENIEQWQEKDKRQSLDLGYFFSTLDTV